MIELKNVSKIFGDVAAVNSVSFELEKGEIGCIIGTSGCGKTTTLKMINRLIEPTSGEILVDGKMAKSVDPIQWRRNIGYVIQKAGLLPHLTIFENISILSKIMNKDKAFIQERVKELMQVVDLPFEEIADRYPRELSGGQQQRVAVARALASKPKFILADEPTANLDTASTSNLLDIMSKLNENEKITFIFSTHDQRVINRARRVITLEDGKIVGDSKK